jgi:fused signal recognition particle receptor
LADEQRKPGFFSRILDWKSHEPADAQHAPVEEPVAEAPPPAAEAPAAEPATQKKGFLRRLFKGGDEDSAPPLDRPAASAEVAPTASAASEKNWFSRLAERIGKASQSIVGRMLGAIGLRAKLDEDTLETIEEILIQSDVSYQTTMKIVQSLRERSHIEKIEGRDAIIDAVKDEIRAILLKSARPFDPSRTKPPYIVLVVGVNGVGKTTTIGKMAKRCADSGMKVMLVAGDTFRAAAVEQLELWAGRTGAVFMKAAHGADASGLAFDALAKAVAEKVDIVFVDTAGRLHTKSNLMAELAKVERVIKKQIPEAPHETLLVIDATTGQNAVQQVLEFSKAVPLNGLVMTKLDGTAKGGILISIRDMSDVPVTLIGVGEGIDDLRDFDPVLYADALFSQTVKSPTSTG